MNNLATQTTNNPLLGVEIMEKALKFAEIIAQSDIIPTHYRGKTANVFIAIQTAFRMNLDPMQVMQNTYVVHGKLGMVTAFAIALANKSGLFDSGIRYRIDGSGNDLNVTAYAKLKKTSEEISYTIRMKDAIAEGWTTNTKYKSLPELMLRYRAATLLIRTHVPEVLNGMHMVKEIEDTVISTRDVTPKSQEISKKLDFVLAEQEEQQEEEKINCNLEGLLSKIEEHNISKETVSKWCDKAGVEDIAFLSSDKIQKCIEHIDTKYN